MLKIRDFVKGALLEDIGRGDLFSPLAPRGYFQAKVVAKCDGVLSGEIYAKEVANILNFKCEFLKIDSEVIEKGDTIAMLEGKADALLSAERVFLNLLQHSSGIATNTAKFSEKLLKYSVKLLDTRKTRPYLREFEKYSVKNGGGVNHRFGLDDCLMLKDTHLKTILNLKEFIEIARESIPFTSKIEVEADSVEFAKEAIDSKVDILMCDNLTPEDIIEVVKYRNSKDVDTLLEASGNITLENIEEYAKVGVDAISSGSLIHQATWLDISMKFD